MKFIATKVDGVLVGADQDSKDAIASLGLDTVVGCHVSQKRNYKNLQRFMVFIEEAYQLQSHFDNKEWFRKWLVMKAGYCDVAVAPNGKAMFLPQSIDYSHMEEEEFKIVFNKCVNTFIDWARIKMTDNDFWRICDYE